MPLPLTHPLVQLDPNNTFNPFSHLIPHFSMLHIFPHSSPLHIFHRIPRSSPYKVLSESCVAHLKDVDDKMTESDFDDIPDRKVGDPPHGSYC